ncbi:MAG TPA: DciA family protein [Gammaproteobacteria bacterium]
MNRAPRSLAELLRSGQLAALREAAEDRREMTARIRALLPPEEAEHLRGASMTESGDLVLVMDSPAWAARVRYCTAGLPAGRVRVRVLPEG